MEYHSRELSSAKRMHWWLLSSMALVLVLILWSPWFLLQSSIGQQYPCKYLSTTFVSFGTSQSAALVSLSCGRTLSVWILKGWEQWMIGSGLCYARCVKKRGSVFTAAFGPLIQIIPAMIEIPLLHESHFTLGSVVGPVLVIVGLYILLWGRESREAKDSIES